MTDEKSSNILTFLFSWNPPKGFILVAFLIPFSLFRRQSVFPIFLILYFMFCLLLLQTMTTLEIIKVNGFHILAIKFKDTKWEKGELCNYHGKAKKSVFYTIDSSYIITYHI